MPQAKIERESLSIRMADRGNWPCGHVVYESAIIA